MGLACAPRHHALVRADVSLPSQPRPFRLLSAGPLLAAGLLALLAGCTSVNHLAINRLGDALATSGTGFASDSDPELIRDAAPFSLKLIESLLEENPHHAGLLAAAASGFTQYGYAFVQQEADRTEDKDTAAAAGLRTRARRLYLRGRDYGLRGLDLAHPGFSAGLRARPAATLAACTAADVRLLYWTAASWAAAIAVSKDDVRLISDLPAVEALIDRATTLDADYDSGAIHSFLITYELSRANGTGDPAARSRAHFERAVALTHGGQAGPYVSYAEAVCIRQQDRAQFEVLLRQALAIDADAHPPWRLVNLVMQRRARWLLSRIDELFLPVEKSS